MYQQKMHNLAKILFAETSGKQEFNEVFGRIEKLIQNLQFNFFSHEYAEVIRSTNFNKPSYMNQLLFQQKLKSEYRENNNLELWLALIDIYQKDKYPQLGLVSLRLMGVRDFLHPKKNIVTPFFLAGLYTFTQLHMRSLTASFLLKANLSPFCELGITISRANLLVNLNQMNSAGSVVSNFNLSLKKIYPSLQVEIFFIPLENNDFSTSKFIEKTIQSNSVKEDKKKDKSDFFLNSKFYSYEKLEGDILEIQQMIFEKNTKIVISNNNNSDFPILFSVDYPSKERAFFEKENFFPKTDNIYLIHKTLNEIGCVYPRKEYGIVRIDVSSFLKNSLNYQFPSVCSLQNYRSYHHTFFHKIIPETIASHNLISKEEKKIFIMYSLLDDCTLFGPTLELNSVVKILKNQYLKRWSGILKQGYGYIEPETTPADLSFQALTSMSVT